MHAIAVAITECINDAKKISNMHIVYAMVCSYHRKVIVAWDQLVTTEKPVEPIRTVCTLQFLPSVVAQHMQWLVAFHPYSP